MHLSFQLVVLCEKTNFDVYLFTAHKKYHSLWINMHKKKMQLKDFVEGDQKKKSVRWGGEVEIMHLLLLLFWLDGVSRNSGFNSSSTQQTVNTWSLAFTHYKSTKATSPKRCTCYSNSSPWESPTEIASKRKINRVLHQRDAIIRCRKWLTWKRWLI